MTEGLNEFMLLQPRFVVLAIVNFKGVLSNLQGFEGVYHHCQFLRTFFANTCLVGAGVWSVWNTRRVQGNISWSNTRPAHKVTINIIQHFVRIYIGVIVGRWNGFWVIVV